MTYDRGHGRQEIRTIQVMSAPPNLRFPHARQVFLIERHVHDLTGNHLSSIAVLGVTDLTAGEAGPAELLQFNRGQWSIENKDHYVRDVTFRRGPLPRPDRHPALHPRHHTQLCHQRPTPTRLH
jgi:hypothetical protein